MHDHPSPEAFTSTGFELWPHTGIKAPTTFELRDVVEVVDTPSLEFSGQLHHPELGHVGTIFNRGIVGGTRFQPGDDTEFDRDYLRAYALRCRQYGRHLAFGADTLLDAIRTEYLTAAQTTLMRQTQSMLVRQYAPANSDQEEPFHGDLVHLPHIALSRAERQEELNAVHPHADPPPSLYDWQMFNGRMWRPLYYSAPHYELGNAARFDAIVCGGHLILETTHGLADGWRVADPLTGPTGDQQFYVATDPYPLSPRAWCRCPLGPRSTYSRFEVWNGHGGLIASGEVHAARRCRRLVVLD